MSQTDPRIDAWLARCPHPETAPLVGMAEAGLLVPEASYRAIARLKADMVDKTGSIGLASVWGGRQMVYRFFIDGFGTPAQRDAWRGKAASVAISEPGVGAHPKLLKTIAMFQGDTVRIDGEKAWVSNGPDADVVVVFAIVAEAAGRKRYGAFLVPTDTPGLSMKDMPEFHALRPSRHCALTLDGCLVPRSAQLGPPGLALGLDPNGSAYERMALPFRDQEDAVGAFSLLGAFRHLARRLGQRIEPTEETTLALGGIVALIAVFAAAAEAVVAQLDASRLDNGSPTLVGLRVLAADLLQRCRALHPPGDDALLSDIEAVLGVARGPRLARQARLGQGLLRAPQPSPARG